MDLYYTKASATMHNKDKVILDKKLPYEYNICLYVLEELCDKGVINVFEMTEAIILKNGKNVNNKRKNPSTDSNRDILLRYRRALSS